MIGLLIKITFLSKKEYISKLLFYITFFMQFNATNT